MKRADVSGFELVPAVDGSKLPRHDLELATAPGRYLYPSAAMVGCSFSHRNVRRCIADFGCQAAVVTEDDCVPLPGFTQTVSEIAAAISGRTAVLLYAENANGVALRRQPAHQLTKTSLYEPTEPEHVFSALAYVVTGDAARSMGAHDHPHYEPDRWGNYLADGVIDQLLVAYPFAASNALFGSTIGHSSTKLPRPLRYALDATPGVRHYLRNRRRAYIDRANTPRFIG